MTRKSLNKLQVSEQNDWSVMKMSNDLISRKLVYADDIHRYIKAEINPYGKPFEGSAYEFGLKIMEYIENMNVAYDVDRGVERLKNVSYYSEPNYTQDGYSLEDEYEIVDLEDAIEIVKAGGNIDKDVSISE